MSTIVNPQSATFNEILDDLQRFVSENSENSFKEFSVGSAGMVVLDLLAGLGSFLHHDVMTARRESIPELARLRSTLTGMAQIMGYPVRRKSAPKLRIVVNVAQGTAQTPISRFSPIGSFRGLPISVLKDYVLQPGINEIYCAIGEWKRHVFNLDRSSNFSKYLVLDDSVENDLLFSPRNDRYSQKFPLLELWSTAAERVGTITNRTRIELVEYSEEMDSNSCQIRTHVDGVILSFGDGVFGKKIFLTDTLEFTYLSTRGLLEGISVRELEGGFSSSLPGTIMRVDLLYPGSVEDDIEKIRIALSSYNSARRRMVTAEDHKSLLLSYPGVVSANVSDDSSTGCCSVNLTCLLSDGHRLDENTSEVIREGSFSLNSANVFFQSSELYPSSIVLPQTGFTSSLSTGTKVWLRMTEAEGTDLPQGIVSNQFYWVIRTAGSLNFRFATSKINALFGVYVQINPPVSGGNVDFTADISIHQDTLKTRDVLGASNVIYESQSAFGSSLEVSEVFFDAVSTADRVLVTYSEPSVTPVGLPNNTLCNVIKVAGDETRIQFAADAESATAGVRMQINPASSSLSGTVTVDRLKFSEEFVINPANLVLFNPENPSEPGYLDVTGSRLSVELGGCPLKVRLRVLSGGTVLPGGLSNGGVYWIYNPSASRVSFASSRDNADPSEGSPIGVPLSSPGSPVVGKIALDVFHDSNVTVSVTPASGNLVFETAYSLSSSLDLSSSPYWVEGIGATPYTGMKVRIYSDGATIPPEGLTLGEFYYLIPIPGTNRVRFATTRDKALGTDTVPQEYVELFPPSVGELGGYLMMDMFLDFSSFPVSPTNLYYQDIGQYINSINLGRSVLTGDNTTPYGYPTGTKILLVSGAGAVLPGGLFFGEFYYLMRVAGTNNVRFATTRTNALDGVSIPLYNNGTPKGSIEFKLYATPEEDQLRGYLENFRIAGERINFIDPVPVVLNMEAVVVISSATNFSYIQNEIVSILRPYTNNLNRTFYVGEVYKKIINIPNVLRVYVKKPVSDYTLAFNEYFVLPGDTDSNSLFDSNHITLVSGENSFVDIGTLPSDSDGYGD